MLREELTGYDIPVPFNIKHEKATINFQTDGNNWALPNYAYGNKGRWVLDFEVIYPAFSTIQHDAIISSTTASTETFQPGMSLGYTCKAECKYYEKTTV